jgi:hypothetical protein
MSFRQENFHGGRAYASDSRDENRASLIITWIKLHFSRLSPGSPRKVGEGFSFLGSDEHRSQARELDTKVFPMAHRRRSAAEALGQGRPHE